MPASVVTDTACETSGVLSMWMRLKAMPAGENTFGRQPPILKQAVLR
jgi:hypothetical protein